jgi:hypothetical protein
MPGYDGTGPRGRGPMTGRGGGYCMLKIPQSYDEPQTGFAGVSGKAVTLLPVSQRVDITSLYLRARQVRRVLCDIDRRTAILEVVIQRRDNSRRIADNGNPARCRDRGAS